ncbi:TetR/AcrR family transcriptional regulator [Ornithinibacillus contaminans]|uniref:TetR/AcrR family transcriptional regulator n=1 Tax=Ornithinibacillus contaminans TaxID=694055 RepID=UPI00064E0D0C|nr:TetR/AcrR family transcriptional regulator [Ornithinibacillus contaminans]
MRNQEDQMDRRVIRTRQLLKNALIELLQEMDIEKISVNRLAERATINRVTFYLHYQDISDMLEKLSDEMISEITSLLDEPINPNASNHEENIRMLEKFLEHIAANGEFYKTILASKRIPIFKERLLAFLTDWLDLRIESKIEGGNSFVLQAGIQRDILLWYDAAALIGTVVAWLRNDMPYSPSYLAKQIYIIHKKGIFE